MKHTDTSLHLPPPPKTPEQITNRHDFLERRKRALAATASHFKGGKRDAALATKLLILDLRQRELLWCLSKKPPFHA